jgi:outer membrane protein assembly factor BamB
MGHRNENHHRYGWAVLAPTASLPGNGVGNRLRGAVAAWLAVLVGVSVGAAVASPVSRGPGGPPVPIVVPEPGRLTPVWDQPLRLPQIGTEASMFDPGTATIVRWAGMQIWAVDAGTGRVRWTQLINATPQDGLRSAVTRVIVSDGTVVAVGTQGLDGQRRLVVGFRATDGRRLWQARIGGPVTAEGRLLLVQPDDSSVTGVDVTNGAARWTSRLPAGCTITRVASDELAAVKTACATGSFVVALDPRDGHKRWQLSVPAIEGPEALRVAGRLVLWGGGEDFQYRLVDPSGRVIATRPAGSGLGYASLAASGDVALVRTFGGDPDVQQLEALDPVSGESRWRTGTRAFELTLAAGRAYAVESLPAPLLPAAVSVVDLRTGQTSLVATSFIGGIPGGPAVTLLGVVNGTLLLHYWTRVSSVRVAHVTAYRTTPVDPSAGYAGGARPEDWPDACGLLAVADLARTFPGVRYTSYPRASTGIPEPFPHATTCDYQPSPITGPPVSVAVGWVGFDEAQASSLLAYPSEWGEAAAVTPDVADESIVVESGYPPDRVEVVLRVGRRVVSVSVAGDLASAKALARIVAAHLHALPG